MVKQKNGIIETADPTTKYGKYIIYRTREDPYTPFHKPGQFHMYLDGRSVEDGFCWVQTIISEAQPEDIIPRKPHYHDAIEYVALLGTDPDNPEDLGGEVVFWIGDEKFTVTRSCVLTIPAGVSHCPFHFKRVDRPIVFSSCSPVPELHEYISRDPMWQHLPDPPQLNEVPG